MTSVLRRTSATTARTKPTTGDTKTSFVDTDHLGWLKCDGRGLDKTAYNLLFGVIGYTFGGSGSTFNLPDGRGRVVGNKGTITEPTCGTVSFPSGLKTGEVNHKLTIAEMPAHNHNNATGSPGANTAAAGTTSNSITNITHNSNSSLGLMTQNGADTMDGDVNSGGEPNLYVPVTALSLVDPGHTHTIASNGGNECHNNMQPTLFYGNMFIYGGIMLNDVYPYDTRPAPVLI